MNVYLTDEQDEPLDTAPLIGLAERILSAEDLPEDTEVSILLVGEDDIAAYNRRFMGREGSTDVLSFPIESLVPGRPPARSPGDPPIVLGDIFICPRVVRGQAAGAGVAFADEMNLIVAHGLLHLLGYHHDSDAEAERMRTRERELLGGGGGS